MYCPAHFSEDKPEVLHSLMAQHPFAAIVAAHRGALVADHIPLMYEPEEGTLGKLVGHVAKSNPLWQAPAGTEHLLIFQGPSAYVSPNWYPTKAESGKVVPTWNYAVVHVHATLTANQDPEALLALLTKLTDHHEAAQAKPWQVADAPADYIERMMGAIVRVDFSIQRMQGKWKVSQNQPQANRLGVVDGLRGLGSDAATEMASLVQQFGGEAGQ